MLEAFGKFALRGTAVDAVFGAIAGSALGLIVSSMARELIMVAILFAVIQAFNTIGRKTRLRRSSASSRRNLLLPSQ